MIIEAPGRHLFTVASVSLSLVLALGAAGCSRTPTAGPTPSAVASPADPPTPTPSPTSSAPASATSPPEPSPTPKPIPTPTPTPTPTLKPSPSPKPPEPAVVTQRDPGWALDRIDQRALPLNRRYLSTGEGRGVTVYVIDGLFDVLNPEFQGRASVGLKLGKTCVLEDGINHGLFVAGLVAGRRTGVAKQAKIVSVGSSYGCEGAGAVSEEQLTARVVRAVEWVAANAERPAVVNMSLNADEDEPELAAAVRRLIKAGLTVVVSAGNRGEDACRSIPAGLPSVVTVSGSTKSDREAGLNHGRCVNIFAPAEGVTSVVDSYLSETRTAQNEGAATSWAAPIVSGAAALYLSSHPKAGPNEVRAWLIDNATPGVVRGNLRDSPNRLLFTRGPR